MQNSISSIVIRDFGCIKNLALNLTKFHAVIGPNDCGKSTLLRAVRTAMQLVGGKFTSASSGLDSVADCKPFHPMRHDLAYLWIKFSKDINYNCQIQGDKVDEGIKFGNKAYAKKRSLWEAANFGAEAQAAARKAHFSLQNYQPRFIRLDLDALGEPCELILSNQPLDLRNEKGVGIASVFDVLINKDVETFNEIRSNALKLFPTVKKIGFENIAVSENRFGKVLKVELVDGRTVSPPFVSAGLLFYLAYSALQYLDPASILLIEEPENGLHPSRIKEIMAILREVSKTTQVLIATHSPLVINEMEPDEVTVMWRDEKDGSQACPMKKTKNFDQRASVYALGELWLSYANGIDEKPLREGSK